MPRSLSTALQTQVSSTATKTAFLVELNLSSTIRLTDYYTNIVFDSNTYEAGGSFLTVDATAEIFPRLIPLSLKAFLAIILIFST